MDLTQNEYIEMKPIVNDKKRPLDPSPIACKPIPEVLETRLTKKFEIHPNCPTPLLTDCKVDFNHRPKTYLEQQHSHACDSRIQDLDEPHVYFIDQSCDNVMSVTEFVHCFFPDFNDKEEAAAVLETKTFQTKSHQPSFKYYGCSTVNDVLERWEDWQKQGTVLHKRIEDYLNEADLAPLDEDNIKPWNYFLEFINGPNWKWEHYRTEWAIFDPETRIAGKIDYLGYDPVSKTFVMFDWKRVGNISDRCNGEFQGKAPTFGYEPCHELRNCKKITYDLQQNVYKYILETYYGMKVSRMYLLQLHPTLKTAGWHVVNDMGAIVEKMMNVRRAILNKNKK